MKVYILMQGVHDGDTDTILAVYDSSEKAEKALALVKRANPYAASHWIVEFEINN